MQICWQKGYNLIQILIHQITSTMLNIQQNLLTYFVNKSAAKYEQMYLCNLTANWQQKLNKLCVTLFDDKLTAKIEHTLCSAMQSSFNFCCQFAVRLCTQAFVSKTRAYCRHRLALDLSSIFERIWCQLDDNLLTGILSKNYYLKKLYIIYNFPTRIENERIMTISTLNKQVINIPKATRICQKQNIIYLYIFY